MSTVPDFRIFVLGRLAGMRLSQRQFAIQVGLDSTTVSKILLGKRRAPLEDLDRWAEVLKVTAGERSDFDMAAALTHCPEVVIQYVKKLERLAEKPERLPARKGRSGRSR
jgi:transcriptional regulator with XRE-family HTH domain